jgi:probable DNA metabolism protein
MCINTYIYDGTFEGLLTVLAAARDTGNVPDDITPVHPHCGGLFQRVEEVGTEPELAAQFAAEIERRISPGALKTISRAFLAGAPGGEMLICRYLDLGLQVGSRLGNMLGHERVAPVNALARTVAREAHRMKGFVRFREVRDGFYYAPLEPDHDVLPLIARHFVDRFHNQHWVIHDLRRGRGIIYDAGRRGWMLTDIVLDGVPGLTEREIDFQALWRRCFEQLVVRERLNLKLQSSRLPRKHRRHLVEF